MRVNISYSVELEDVLEELKLLYRREHTKMRLVASESEKNLSEIAMALEDYRKAMASFDVKLVEISNILSGYHSIKLGPSIDENQEIQEEIEVNNE